MNFVLTIEEEEEEEEEDEEDEEGESGTDGASKPSDGEHEVLRLESFAFVM